MEDGEIDGLYSKWEIGKCIKHSDCKTQRLETIKEEIIKYLFMFSCLR
jgi:hypothetical protein